MKANGSIRQKCLHKKYHGKWNCQARAGLQKRWQKRDEELGRDWPRPCENCSKPMNLQRYGQRFCSTACRVKYHYDMKQRKKNNTPEN